MSTSRQVCTNSLIASAGVIGIVSVTGLLLQKLRITHRRKETKEPPNVQDDDPKVVARISSAFPGSLRSVDLASRVKSALAEHGYDAESTLLATSLCCDEICRELEHELGNTYRDNFAMGGLSGFPFGGATSFGAMAIHIPDGGSCLIVYGPHVGVASDGTVGTVERRGRVEGGACCGSAVNALEYVEQMMAHDAVANGGHTNGGPHKGDTDQFDAQQEAVKSMLLPHGERVLGAKDKNVELPLALFDCQDEMMRRIVGAMCGMVAGDGKIALLGGIQINTPEGMSDYFLPKVFEIKNNKGEHMESLLVSLEDESFI